MLYLLTTLSSITLDAIFPRGATVSIPSDTTSPIALFNQDLLTYFGSSPPPQVVTPDAVEERVSMGKERLLETTEESSDDVDLSLGSKSLGDAWTRGAVRTRGI